MFQRPQISKGAHTLTLLHVEPDVAWREAICRVCAEIDSINYCGYCFTAHQAIDACRALMPDIVLLELALPDFDIFTAIETLTKEPSYPQVAILTTRCDDVSVHLIDMLNIRSYLWKTPHYENDLKCAFNALSAGKIYLPSEVVKARNTLRSSSNAFFKILSKTEQSLVPYFGKGVSDEAIAVEFNMNVLTVRWHRRRILAPLGLHRSIDLIQWAHDKGFVHDMLPSPPCMFESPPHEESA